MQCTISEHAVNEVGNEVHAKDGKALDSDVLIRLRTCFNTLGKVTSGTTVGIDT
jgi:hypothetical protein